MRTLTLLSLGSSLLVSACTSLDFFGFADDAPLLAVERPEGYKSGAFGAGLAASGSDEIDLLAVSGGSSTQVAFFRLSSEGSLLDLAAPDSYYPSSWGEAQDSGAGGSLASLPAWRSFDSENNRDLLVEGCIAIGEPSGSPPSVRVVCRAEDRQADRLSVPSIVGEAAPSDKNFGLAVAAIRPASGGGFLLAAGAERWVAVYASGRPGDSTSAAFLDLPSDESSRRLEKLAAGRALLSLPWSDQASERFFVAASSSAKKGGGERIQVFVENGTRLEPLLCVARPDEPGFGATMVAGDLNGDGKDELVVSSSVIDGRMENVYVYDVAVLAAQARGAPDVCLTKAAPLTVIAAPGEFESTVCSDGCSFGVALAIGDIATDDGGAELAIGAPGATVHGKKDAGAVYVYRGEQLLSGDAPSPASRIVDSAAEPRDALGSALAVAPMAGRNELVIGAPGASTFFVAFCSNVGENIEQGADVPVDGSGKVVSTRCRLK